MTRTTLVTILCALVSSAAFGATSPAPAPSQLPDRPAASQVPALAGSVKFENKAHIEDKVAPMFKGADKFSIKVQFHSTAGPVAYAPATGAVVARVSVVGIPAGRGIPDGDYYLWMGGASSDMKAELVKTDGSLAVPLDVLPAAAWRNGRVIRPEIEQVPADLKAAANASVVPTTRAWRRICVELAPEGGAAGERCVRVPAS